MNSQTHKNVMSLIWLRIFHYNRLFTFFSLSLPNFFFCLVLFYYFLGLFSIVSTDLFKTLSDFLFIITIKFYSFSLSLISLLFQSYLFRFFSLFYFFNCSLLIADIKSVYLFSTDFVYDIHTLCILFFIFIYMTPVYDC